MKLGNLPSPPDTFIHLVKDEQANKIAVSFDVTTDNILLKLMGEDATFLLPEHCKLCAYAQEKPISRPMEL